MGHSLGALTTIGTAAGYPEGVKAAVLLDPPLYTALDPAAIDIDPNTKQYFQFVFDLKSSSPSFGEIVGACLTMMPPNTDRQAVEDWAGTLAGVAPGTVQVVLEKRFWGDMDLGQALDQIQCPTLMIHGDWENGAAVRDADVAYFKARLPNAVVVHMPQTDHGLKMANEPELVLGHVKTFLQSI
jgi:pimeloyl-ACP methyl ester carboxylesterase